MNIDELDRRLDEERKALKASSCTLYVRDAYWNGEYRLVCMPGVTIREPMYGLVSPDPTKRMICEGKAEVFLSSAERADGLQNTAASVPSGIQKKDRLLFGEFREREGVKAYARLFHLGSDGKPEVVLFVNFAKRVEFDRNLQRRIRSVFASTLTWLKGANDQLRRMDATALAEAAKILPPSQSLNQAYASAEAGVTASQLEAQFKSILKVSLNALGINESEGLGTIHLYKPGAETLELAAYCGCVLNLEGARVQDIKRGNPPGIAAWVALRQRAILVNDLETSRFRTIHVVINKDVKSELAVPMMADGKLVGVLNIESKKKEAFSHASVRSIWYAANYAASAYQLETRSQLTRNLLDICATAATDKEGGESLKKIAKELSTICNAAFVDIWRYDPRVMRFIAAASTDPDFKPNARSEGWSAYIRSTLKPVWLSNIANEKSFIKQHWAGGSWVEEAPSGPVDPPASVNTKLITSGIKAQLGMPILAQDDCVGVAFIKYKHTVGQPNVELMKDAFSYVSQVGLVMEAVQWRLEMPGRNQLRLIGKNLGAWWCSGKLNFGSLDTLLEGYVSHRSFHGDVSGDFHAIKAAGDSIGLLIGDGTGEAVPGLLNALPLIASFELFGSETGSTRYVMEKLMSVANKVGITGTGSYCTFTRIEKDIFLSVTSAGHPFLILIRADGVENRIPRNGGPGDGPSFGYKLNVPLSEEHKTLRPDDTLIAYTDGVGEALCNGSQPPEVYAKEIVRCATSPVFQSCEDIAEGIMAASEAAGPIHDDMTVCVIRVKTGA